MDDKRVMTTYNGDEPYLFISYAHKDTDRVLPLIRAMQDAGYRIWFDQGIELGTEWSNNIAIRLRGCGAFLFFASHNSVKSENCLDEVAYAKAHCKTAVLAFLEEDVVLPEGTEMQTARFQRVFVNRQSSVDAFVQTITTAAILDPCREICEATMVCCARCGAKMQSGSKFCDKCGTPITPQPLKMTATDSEWDNPIGVVHLDKKRKKGKRKALRVLGIIGAVLLWLCIVRLSLFFWTENNTPVVDVATMVSSYEQSNYGNMTETEPKDAVSSAGIESVVAYTGSRIDGSFLTGYYTDEVTLTYYTCEDKAAGRACRDALVQSMIGFDGNKNVENDDKIVYTNEITGKTVIISRVRHVVVKLEVDYADYAASSYRDYDDAAVDILEEFDF